MKWRCQSESAHGLPAHPSQQPRKPRHEPAPKSPCWSAGRIRGGLGDTLVQAKGAALLTLGCFALAGALVVDDYGVAFELPLLFIELAMGLEDYRSVHLTRHILSHLFFLAGGWFCYLLAHRMGGSRLVALAAMLLFLLHPRLYAHSFFNTKDTPFLSMFMITLFLTHRAFRKDDCAAFLSCGLAVGLLTNIRILGVMLFAAVLGLRLLDLIQAADGRTRKHILSTAGLFTAASALILYATWPYLWSDPFGHFAEAFLRMADHPQTISAPFQGEWVVGKVPPHYAPTWLAITTPPLTLLLGGIGLLAAVRRTAAQPGAILRNGALRFEMLLVACLTLPVAAVVAFDSSLYHGWRQMYFLHAPLVLLAGAGLQRLTAVPCHAALRTCACALAAGGLASAAASLILLHPNQALHFNFLVDRQTPERLRSQYTMDYYETTFRQGLEHLLDRRPGEQVRVDMAFGELHASILPPSERRRVRAGSDQHADFHITSHREHTAADARLKTFAPLIHSLKIYNNTVMGVAALNLALVDEAQRKPYLALLKAAAARPPIVRSRYDVHITDGQLVYVKDACRAEDTRPLFLLHIWPAGLKVLPEHRKPFGFEDREFRFGARGVRFEGKCLLTMPLPAYGIDRITIGQVIASTDKFGGRNRCRLWTETIRFDEQRKDWRRVEAVRDRRTCTAPAAAPSPLDCQCRMGGHPHADGQHPNRKQ